MKELGLTLPFTPGEPTEVSDSSNNHKLYVSNILQKTFVEVNEEGTKAAARTAVLRVPTSRSRRPKPSFVADHPFIFMIREETSIWQCSLSEEFLTHSWLLERSTILMPMVRKTSGVFQHLYA
ncbi:hypothetical protein K1719_044582 [Acacia pycnantha]|nr:hypothetical protein K1719_044582 [Acacia pycnantha]